MIKKIELNDDGDLTIVVAARKPDGGKMCKVTDKGNHLIASTGGVQSLMTQWGLVGLTFNAWIKPEHLSDDVQQELAKVTTRRRNTG